jgi:MFS family permease
MNVLVSVVAPFFPTEAKRLTGASNGVIGVIFAVFPLTNLAVCPVINFAIRTVGRKATLMLGLLTLASSTVAFGLSESIPLWIFTRILQGAGSAAAGECRA